MGVLSLIGASKPPPLVGDWLTEDGGGVIRVEPCGGPGMLCGSVEGLSGWPANGQPIKDFSGRSQCHLVFIQTRGPGEDGRWHGTVTNPEDGHTYQAELWLGDDGALRLRGFVMLEAFGSTQRWVPFRGHLTQNCHFSLT